MSASASAGVPSIDTSDQECFLGAFRELVGPRVFELDLGRF